MPPSSPNESPPCPLEPSLERAPAHRFAGADALSADDETAATGALPPTEPGAEGVRGPRDRSEGFVREAPRAQLRHHGALLRQIPIVEHLRGYSAAKARADLRAGLNVALLDFPQSMAYALIAGLPVQVGLYASALGSIVGPIFASSRFVILGTTNATAILLLSILTTSKLPDELRYAALPLLLLMVAVFLLLGAALNAGIVIRYVSRSVVVGYVTAAGLLIAVNQLRHVLGIEIAQHGLVWETLGNTVRALPSAHLVSVGVAGATIAIYAVLRRWAHGWPHVAMTLVLVAAASAAIDRFTPLAVATLPAVPLGSWPVSLPVFDGELFSQLASPALAMAFLALLESSSIAKTLAARAGDSLDVRRQMASLGLANLFSAFGSGMPVSGSLTRSQVNWAGRARTPVSSIVNGALLVAGVLMLGPAIGFIPRAALAALVMIVGVSLIDVAAIRVVLRTTRADAATFLVTAASGLLVPLDASILFGVITSLLFFLHKVAQPRLVEHAFNHSGELVEKTSGENRTIPAVSIVHIEGDLFFASADVFLDQMRLFVHTRNLQVVLLRLRNAHNLDASSALAIGELVRFTRERGCDVVMCDIQDDTEPILRRSGLFAQIGEPNLFRFTPDNPTKSMRDALKRVQQLTGQDKADIILFAQPKPAAS